MRGFNLIPVTYHGVYLHRIQYHPVAASGYSSEYLWAWAEESVLSMA